MKTANKFLFVGSIVILTAAVLIVLGRSAKVPEHQAIGPSGTNSGATLFRITLHRSEREASTGGRLAIGANTSMIEWCPESQTF
jgi:hypothetical protein